MTISTNVPKTASVLTRAIPTRTTGASFSDSYLDKIKNEFGSSLIALWPQNDASGTQITDISGHGFHGTYSNVTLGQPGIGGGVGTAAGYNGTTSYGNVYSAGLAGAFNGAAGTLLVWIKVASSSMFTDAITRSTVRLADRATSVCFRPTTNK